jgi:hypothetical protein
MVKSQIRQPFVTVSIKTYTTLSCLKATRYGYIVIDRYYQDHTNNPIQFKTAIVLLDLPGMQYRYGTDSHAF